MKNWRNGIYFLLRRDRYVEDQGTLALDQTRTYHFDGLGSTIKLTDGSGVITDTFTYDAWGNVTRVSGSTNDNPYLYVGQLLLVVRLAQSRLQDERRVPKHT